MKDWSQYAMPQSASLSPVPPGEPEEQDSSVLLQPQWFNLQAVLCGGVVGGVITMSNLYLGLKTGWTMGVSLFATVAGFALLRSLAKFSQVSCVRQAISGCNCRPGFGVLTPVHVALLTTSAVAAGGK